MLVAVVDTSRRLVDARVRVKTNGATPCEGECDRTYYSDLLPFGELVLFRVPLPHARLTNQNRIVYRGDSGFWCGRLDEDNAHVSVTENGREADFLSVNVLTFLC